MYEMLQGRKAEDGNILYGIIRMGVAAAYTKKAPKSLFNVTENGESEGYVDFAQRKRELERQRRAEEEVE